jgi:hypothetical protein
MHGCPSDISPSSGQLASPASAKIKPISRNYQDQLKASPATFSIIGLLAWAVLGVLFPFSDEVATLLAQVF